MILFLYFLNFQIIFDVENSTFLSVGGRAKMDGLEQSRTDLGHLDRVFDS